MNIVAADRFSFKCKNSNTAYEATKNNIGNWVVSWVDYDGVLQQVTYLASEFEWVLNSWSVMFMENNNATS